MFCAKALHMKPLKIGLMALPRVSARSPAAMVFSSAGLSTISPRASMSAVDSVMETTMTTQSEMIAASANCGGPKWKGVGKPMMSASATGPKSVAPNGIAMTVPMTRPSSTAICLTKPRVKRRSSRTTRRVIPARPRLVAEPKSGASGEGPWAQPKATGMSETPMRVMTVPVTTGGKNRTSLLKKGAAMKPSTPATMTAPKMIGRASFLSSVESTTASMGATAGEGDAVDEGQPGADVPDAERLEEGGEAGGEEAGAGEEGELGGAEADGGADDERRRDHARVHGGHVLEAGGGHLQRRQLLVDGVHGGFAVLRLVRLLSGLLSGYRPLALGGVVGRVFRVEPGRVGHCGSSGCFPVPS